MYFFLQDFWFKEPSVQNFVAGLNYMLKRCIHSTCKTTEVSPMYFMMVVFLLFFWPVGPWDPEVSCSAGANTRRIRTHVPETGQKREHHLGTTVII